MYQYGDGTEPKTRTKVNQRKPTEHNPGGTKRKKKTELKIRLALPLGKVLLAFAAQNSHCPFQHSSHNTPALGHRSFPVRGRPCETFSALSTVTGYTRREKNTTECTHTGGATGRQHWLHWRCKATRATPCSEGSSRHLLGERPANKTQPFARRTHGTIW